MAVRTPKVSIEDWDLRRLAHKKRYEDKMEKYDQYCDWYCGDFDDVWVQVTGDTGEVIRGPVSAVNMVGLVARSWVSHLFFNAPTGVVKEQPGFARGMADLQTRTLNNLIQETGLYDEGRATLLDAFLAPVFVMKVGYSCDIAENAERLKFQREYAQSENQRMLEGVEVFTATHDHHQAHLDVVNDFIETLMDGKTIRGAPSSVLEAAQAHRDKHAEASTLR